jgi:NAD(P)H-dependent FMN reductase
MKKITIISGTNRQNSYTEKVSKYYHQTLQQNGHEVQVLLMKELEGVLDLSTYFNKGNVAFDKLVEKYISTTNHFIFVIPEYNGSYPGILKLFLDSVPPATWTNKAACITGIASGRAGNLRGIEHLTGVLNYLKMHVYHNRLPISQIDKIFVATEPLNEDTAKVIKIQLDGFLNFN